VRRLGAVVLAAALVGVVAAPSASATADRAEYVAQVNPICTATNAQLEKKGNKAFKGSPNNPIAALVKLLGYGNKVVGREIARIAAVPAAPGDETLVASWVQSLRNAKRQGEKIVPVFKQIFRSLKHLDKTGPKQFARLEKRLKRVSNAAVRAYNSSDSLGTQLGLTECVSPNPVAGSAGVATAAASAAGR
jgi:hypothetical protein